MNELLEWLNNNKISHTQVDNEVIDITGLGYMYFVDTEKMSSIFYKTMDGDVEFNLPEHAETLIEEEVFYVVFKFGDNWYYTDMRQSFQLNILKYIGQRMPCEQSVQYVNLGIHTPFELLSGSFLLDAWVNKAKYLGHDTIGICDCNTMAATYALQKECEAKGMRFVFGYTLTIVDNEENSVGAKVYVLTQQGLQNLLRIQKIINVNNPDKTITVEQLMKYSNGNVLVFDKYSSEWIDKHETLVLDFQKSFDAVFYQVDLSEYKANRIDIRVLQATKYYFDNIYTKKSESGSIRPILITDCYYLDRDDYKNKIILNKIASGAAHEQSDDQYFKDIDEQYEKFTQLFDADRWNIDAIFSECCANTVWIAENANARFETERNFMPKYSMTEEEKEKYGNTHNMFASILEEGLQRLIPKERQDEYRKQMEYEKYIIESTNNVDYLLVQYDTVNWAKKNNILVGCGRGSATGSLLLYLLGITLIDPLRYDLIFERFLLPERAGLYASDVTVIGEDILSRDYVEITLENGKTIKLDKDAELLVKRGDAEEPIVIYADELSVDDDILFDNKDVLFTINEL